MKLTSILYNAEQHLTGTNHENDQSSFLARVVKDDQLERQQYQQFVQTKAGGDWEKGAAMWATSKNRSSDDIFGERQRQQRFVKIDFDFSSFSETDWTNYWLIAQHCDWDRNFQKKALGTIQKHLGTNNTHYKYLYDRISCGLNGKQKYGTQDICEID